MTEKAKNARTVAPHRAYGLDDKIVFMKKSEGPSVFCTCSVWSYS